MVSPPEQFSLVRIPGGTSVPVAVHNETESDNWANNISNMHANSAHMWVMALLLAPELYGGVARSVLQEVQVHPKILVVGMYLGSVVIIALLLEAMTLVLHSFLFRFALGSTKNCRCLALRFSLFYRLVVEFPIRPWEGGVRYDLNGHGAQSEVGTVEGRLSLESAIPLIRRSLVEHVHWVAALVNREASADIEVVYAGTRVLLFRRWGQTPCPTGE